MGLYILGVLITKGVAMNQTQGQEISASLEGLALGAHQVFRNLVLSPLLAATWVVMGVLWLVSK